MKVLVFREFNSGGVAVFDSKKNLDTFMKEYLSDFYELNSEPPKKEEDYDIIEVTLNVDYDTYNWEECR